MADYHLHNPRLSAIMATAAVVTSRVFRRERTYSKLADYEIDPREGEGSGLGGMGWGVKPAVAEEPICSSKRRNGIGDSKAITYVHVRAEWRTKRHLPSRETSLAPNRYCSGLRRCCRASVGEGGGEREAARRIASRRRTERGEGGGGGQR
jgi:hypothetical protein